MNDLKKAKELLANGEYTCVMVKNEEVYTSTHRGVKPLVTWYESDVDFTSFSAADKVVGKATAFLYILLKVKSVYAKVISKSALEVLKSNNIEIQYTDLVEHIINRQGDGICPFESAVMNCNTPQKAYIEIKNKMKELFR